VKRLFRLPKGRIQTISIKQIDDQFIVRAKDIAISESFMAAHSDPDDGSIELTPDLYQQMQIQAITEGRDVGTITEELYREYLKRPKAKGKK
jgi:hypothetical protein